MTSTAGTLDLSGLSLTLEQAIETAVEKAVKKAVGRAVEKAVGKAVEKAADHAVARAMGNNHGATNVLPEPLINQDTTLAPGGYSPTTVHVQHGHQHTGPEERLSVEVWEWIFKYLYPSQLSRVSMVCRTFYEIVAELPIWPEIYGKAHRDNQNHAVGGLKPIKGKNPNKDFMLHVCAESFQICELCLSVYSGIDVTRDRLAFFPLPVHVWRVRLASMKTGHFQPFSIEIGPEDWVVRLCLGCRREVFEECPESIPNQWGDSDEWEDTIDPVRAYYLTTRDIDPSADEKTFIMVARQKYGGEIGAQAGAEGSSCDAVTSMESRLMEICLRLTIAAAGV